MVLTWEYKACINWSKVLQILVSEPGYLHSLSNFLEFREKTKTRKCMGYSRVLAVLITDSTVSHCSCSLQFLPRDGAGGGEGEGAELSECVEISGAKD